MDVLKGPLRHHACFRQPVDLRLAKSQPFRQHLPGMLPQRRRPQGRADRRIGQADGTGHAGDLADRGVGQGGQGPTLARLNLPLAAFDQLVRQPAGSMPAYSEKSLPAAELTDIYAYLQSIPLPPAKRPAILSD